MSVFLRAISQSLLVLLVCLRLAVAPAVPLDGSKSVPLDGFNSTASTVFDASQPTSTLPTTSYSDPWANFFLQTPPSGYHVPTTCSLNGDPYPYLPTGYTSNHYECDSFFHHQTDGGTTRSVPAACSSLCTIEAATVQLLFWPTPYSSTGNAASTITSAPGPVISVGPDGYTFTSPSAYVIYSGLSALNAAYSHVGPTIDNLTLAYAPGELSTVNSCIATLLSSLGIPGIKTQEIDFKDFNIPPRWSVIDTHMNCDYCGQQYQYDSPQHSGDELVTGYANMDFGQIPWLGKNVSSWTLMPTIAHPLGLTDVDPLWKHCTSEFRGVWDPPRVMTSVAALGPTSTADPTIASITPDPELHISKTAAAQPASGVIGMNGLPAKTLPPTLNDQGADPQQTGTGTSGDTQEDPQTHTVKSEDPGGSVAHNSPTTHDPQIGASETPSQHLTHTSTSMELDPASAPILTSQSDQGVNSDSGQDHTASLPEMTFPTDSEGQKPSHSAATSEQHTKSILVLPTELSLASGLDVLASATAHPVGTLQSGDSQTKGSGESEATNATPVTALGLSLPSLITAAGQTFTPIGTGTIVVDSNVLSIGGQAVTIQGDEISMGNSGLYIGSTVVALPKASSLASLTLNPISESRKPRVFSAAGATFTAIGSDKVLVQAQTVALGSNAATIDGMTIIYGSSGLEIGTSTFPVPVPSITGDAVFTAESAKFTQHGNSEVLINGVTLARGSSATVIDGKTMSLGASELIIDSSTVALPYAATTSVPLGDIIMSAFGGGPATSSPSIPASGNASSSGVVPFTGSAPRSCQPVIGCVVLCSFLGMLLLLV